MAMVSPIVRTLALFSIAVFCNSGELLAQNENNKVEGAIWRFTMTPKQKDLKPLRGQFRLSNNLIYQKKDPDDVHYLKPVGRNYPAGPRKKRTRFEFKDLEAFTRNGDTVTGLSGKVGMTLKKFGKWSGMLTDGEGRNWMFRCSRIQE